MCGGGARARHGAGSIPGRGRRRWGPRHPRTGRGRRGHPADFRQPDPGHRAMPACGLATQGSQEGPETARRPHPSQRAGTAQRRGSAPSVGPCRSSPGPTSTVSDLCLGGNVFGWTADEPTSFALLDRYVDATPEHRSGRSSTPRSPTATATSERILGAWMASRGVRDRVVVATKASRGEQGAPAGGRRRSARRPSGRCATCRPTGSTCTTRTTTTRRRRWRRRCTAFDELVQAGKVRYVAASNYSAKRLTEALETSERLGVARYVALQTHYNLMERADFEGELQDVVAEAGHGRRCRTSALAKGFLTGKYRAGRAGRLTAGQGRVGVRGGAGRPGARGAGGGRARRTTCRCRRWRCAGWPTSRRSSRRSPAAGRWSSWPTCCRCRTWCSPTTQRQLLTDASA